MQSTSLLLQVFVHLKAVVARVSHKDLAVRGECHALWPIQGISQCVDVGKEGSLRIKHLRKGWMGVKHGSDKCEMGTRSHEN